MNSVDRANLRARLEECWRVEQFNAKHWAEQAARVRRALPLYSGGAREEFEILAVEHDVSAAIATAKVSGLQVAIDALTAKEANHAAAE